MWKKANNISSLLHNDLRYVLPFARSWKFIIIKQELKLDLKRHGFVQQHKLLSSVYLEIFPIWNLLAGDLWLRKEAQVTMLYE